MAGGEKDYGGVVAGIPEPRLHRMTKRTMLMPKGSNKAIEVGAEEEQAPGRALPEPRIKSTPEKFGQFEKRR